MTSHPHVVTGQPCSCGFDWTRYHSPTLTAKTAGKLHDFLMNPKSRPDLQTPEGQRWLQALQYHHGLLGDKFDALTPWLTREWKKGRVLLRPGHRELRMRHEHDPEGHWPEHRLHIDRLGHWADFLQSNHPLRRQLGDIMAHHVGPFSQRVDDWSQAMLEAARDQAAKGGEVVHQWPDGWTVRRLTTPEELKSEGDAMGHCVGGYSTAVQNGHSLIYSLRDPDHRPHVTTEIRPRYVDWHGQLVDMSNLDMSQPVEEGDDAGAVVPHGGEVVQIQGKGNQEPIDDYKTRMADWFRTFPPEHRPTWAHEDDEGLWDGYGYSHYEIDHPDLIPQYERERGGLALKTEPYEDAYGIQRQPSNLPSDYDSLLDNIKFIGAGWHDVPDHDHMQDIYRLARARGEIPQLAQALEGYSDKQQESYDDWVDMNWQHMPRYVEPSDPHGWEDEDGIEADAQTPGARPYWTPRGPEYDRYYDPAEAEKEYEQAERDNQEQHPGMAAVNSLYKQLSPHYGQHPETGEHGYWNELPLPEQPEQPEASQGQQLAPPTAKVASPIIPVNYSIVNQPRDEYIGPQPEFPDRDGMAHRSPEYKAWLEQVTPEFERLRLRRKEWDRAIRHAIATGRVTPERAAELGFRSEGHEGSGDWGEPPWGKWQPLPERLYHVTTNLPAIAASGRLLAPDELDLNGRGRGLGGGTQDTISFTTDPQMAEDIRRSFQEAADVASGRITAQQLVDAARTGQGANKPWLQEMFGDKWDWSQGDPQGLHDLIHGKKRFSDYGVPDDHPLKQWPSLGHSMLRSHPQETWAEHGYYPDEYSRWHTMADGSQIVGNTYRQLSPEEHARATFDWWRNPYAGMRSWAGGPQDPMFFMVDPEWYAKLDPSHVGIVETQPVPGGHGYPVNSMDEWRVPTGHAVNITAINDQPYAPPGSDYTLSKVAHPLYYRWAFSPQTGRVELSSNSEAHPLDVAYHSELGRRLNEPDLVHGYAYRIGGGWRLTDYDHKPVEDQYVVAQVMRALNGEQAATAARTGSWSGLHDDWDRCHLSLPT